MLCHEQGRHITYISQKFWLIKKNNESFKSFVEVVFNLFTLILILKEYNIFDISNKTKREEERVIKSL